MPGDWFTAQQLATACLPGLPGTKAGIIGRAKKEAWKSRDRKARGGGLEYHLSNLPTDARDKLVDQLLGSESKTIAPASRNDLVPVISESLNGWQREVMQARALILRCGLRFYEEPGHRPVALPQMRS